MHANRATRRPLLLYYEGSQGRVGCPIGSMKSLSGTTAGLMASWGSRRLLVRIALTGCSHWMFFRDGLPRRLKSTLRRAPEGLPPAECWGSRTEIRFYCRATIIAYMHRQHLTEDEYQNFFEFNKLHRSTLEGDMTFRDAGRLDAQRGNSMQALRQTRSIKCDSRSQVSGARRHASPSPPTGRR
jgi:hypothetical protein